MCMHTKFSPCFLFRTGNKAHITLPIYSNIYIWMEGRQNITTAIFYCSGSVWSNTNILSQLTSTCYLPSNPLLEHSQARWCQEQSWPQPVLAWSLQPSVVLDSCPLYKIPSPSMRLVVSCHFESIRCCFFCQDRFSSCLFYPLITELQLHSTTLSIAEEFPCALSWVRYAPQCWLVYS